MSGALAQLVASAMPSWAQTATPPQPGAPGAGHDIVMNAHVAPSCRMTGLAPQIVLTGTTDSGEAINTSLSGQGGFTVDCNTPYAMGLQRTTIYSAPGGGAGGHSGAQAANDYAPKGAPGPKVAESFNSKVMRDSGGVASGSPKPDAVARQDAHDLEVVVRVAGVEGDLESQCVMAEAVNAGIICHALAGPDDMRQPLPRAEARIHATMLATGSVAPQTNRAAEVPFVAPILSGVDVALSAATSAAADAAERAIVQKAMQRSGRVRTGDRLTVSLSARY